MSNTELQSTQEQAETQRAEAKRLLLRMFRISEGESNGVIERIVDCILGAAIFEMTAALIKGGPFRDQP